MKEQENQMKKVCGFYVNEMHFTTMILPYIRKEIEAKDEVITILQKDMKVNVEEVLSRMNLNEALQNEILNINWNKVNPIKYSKIKQMIEQTNGQAQNVTILINGNKEFIKIVNEYMEKIIQNGNIQNLVTVINFYDVTEFTNVTEITNSHEYILNTSGIRKIEEVFAKEKKEA